MAKRKLNIMVTDTIKPGKEDVIVGLMKNKVMPALRKQLPDFHWRVYRSALGGMGKWIVIAPMTPENLANYDEWLMTALEKQLGKEEVARIASEWYACVDSVEYLGVVEDEEVSNP